MFLTTKAQSQVENQNLAGFAGRSSAKSKRPMAVPSPGGDLNRLGSGEWNSAKPKARQSHCLPKAQSNTTTPPAQQVKSSRFCHF
jgi:hypothetical protein